MTREEYEQRLEALEREIADLKRENVEDGLTPPHQRPELKRRDQYYYVASDGTVLSLAWTNSLIDCSLRDFCNVFRTYDAAKYAAEYYKVLAEMHEWAGKWDDSWRIVYTPPFIVPMDVALKTCSAGEMRFATREDAENCIKAVGKDRLIKYYFGVRDHEIPVETE